MTTPNTDQSTNPGTSDEYYTPRRFLDLGRFWVGGGFDLDPASTELANRLVRAERWLGKEHDGTDPAWWQDARKVWCNPPFSRAAAFSARMTEHQAQNRDARSVLLTNAVTESAWWQDAATSTSACLLVRARPVFLDPARVAAALDGDERLHLALSKQGRPQTGRSGISLMFFGSGPPALDLMKRASELGIDGVWM